MSLSNRLDQARNALRGNRLTTAFLRLLALAIVALFAFFIVDWLAVNRILPLGWGDTLCRVIMLIALIAVVGRILWDGFLREWRIDRSDDMVALLVEHTHEELSGRLISTVQLNRELAHADGGAEGVSHGMIEALATDTEERCRKLDFLAIVDSRPLKHFAGLACVALAVAGLLIFWKPGHALALMARMALLNVDYPTATRIIAVSHPGRVAEGEPYPIEIEVDPDGVVPDQAIAHVEFSGGRSVDLTLERVADAPFGKAVFRGSVAQAITDFKIRPVANDHRWPRWEPVLVVKRPAVAGVTVRCTYPTYLEMETTDAQVGDLRVPEGTTVDVRIEATKAIAHASLGIREGLDEDVTSIDLAVDAASNTLTGSFTVGQSGTWSVYLQDEDGLAPSSVPRYTISSIPDRVPAVVIQVPKHDKLASPRANWPLRFVVKDDHGIGQGWLKYTVETDGALTTTGEKVEPTPVSIPLPGIAGPGEKSATRETSFDLSRLGVQPGQRVTYWIEVADNRTPEPGLGVSQKQRFTILDNETLRAELDRQRAELFERVNLIKERQKDARDAVDDLRNQVDSH